MVCMCWIFSCDRHMTSETITLVCHCVLRWQQDCLHLIHREESEAYLMVTRQRTTYLHFDIDCFYLLIKSYWSFVVLRMILLLHLAFLAKFPYLFNTGSWFTLCVEIDNSMLFDLEFFFHFPQKKARTKRQA